MKKILLSLLCLLCAATWSMADAYKAEFSAKVWDDNGAKEINGVNWTLTCDGGYFGYDATKGQQIGSSKKSAKAIVISTSDFSDAITSVTVNTSGASQVKATVSVKVGDTEYTCDGNVAPAITATPTDYTFVGQGSGEVVISWENSSAKAIYVKSITVESGSASNLAAPVISMVEDEYNKVAIECDTEGAVITYTINGGESQEYTAPFEISEKSEIVATAAKAGESKVAKSTLYPNMVGSIAAFYQLASPKPVLINAPITAIAAGKNNMFVTDGNTFGVVYSFDLPEVVENGTVFATISGVYSTYGGVAQIANPVVLGEVSVGTPAEPTVVTTADVTAENTCQYIRINNGKYENGMFIDAAGSIKVFNTLGITLPEDGTYDFVGFAYRYNQTLEIVPEYFISGGVVVESTATPEFSIENDAMLAIGSKIEITCATEGADIFYYYNEGDMITQYVEPIVMNAAGTYTLCAYAVKDGMGDSELASVRFTVYDPNVTEKTCVVDFSKQEWSNYSKQTEPSFTQEWVAANGTKFVTVATATGSTYPSIQKDGKLRVYRSNGNVIKVTAPEGYYFVSVAGNVGDANVVNYTVNDEVFTTSVNEGVAEISFQGNPTNVFTFDLNSDENNGAGTKKEGKNFNFTSFSLVIDTYADKEITILDKIAYTNSAEETVETLAYEREYANVETWKPWYAPMEVAASDFEQVIEFAGANADDNTLDFATVSGTLEANKPYMVLPKSTSEIYIAASATLAAAVSNSVEFNDYVLTGVYTAKNDMMSAGAYALAADGNFHPAASDDVTLAPFRFFLTVPAVNADQPVRIRIDGKDATDAISNIIIETAKDGKYYDLQGRKVANPSNGIFIINGKKVAL